MKYLRPVLCIICLLFLKGCATTDTALNKPAAVPIQNVNSSSTKALYVGTYHRVRQGETLWHIASNYGIDIDEIISTNSLTNSSQINTGDIIFIPKAGTNQRLNYASYTDKEEAFIWPVKGQILSKYHHPLKNIPNKGIDMRIGKESEIIASRSGTVLFTNDNLKGYGRTIIIEHKGDFITVYALSLLSQILVKPGEHIIRGAPIAKVKSGRIHFEIRKGCSSQNPYYYLPT